MLLELAIGDAYGAGFEFADRGVIEDHNDLSGYIKHRKHDLGLGRYTDDTQMSIAIAEIMLNGSEWTPIGIADKFVDVFKRDPRPGYSTRMSKTLQNSENGTDFLKKIQTKAESSGAAMRAPPLGFMPDIEKIIEYATLQAKVTHNTETGVNSAIASALMTHYFLHNKGRKKDLPDFIKKYTSSWWTSSVIGEVGKKAYMHIRAAINSIVNEETLSGVLERSVSFGGDTDTVAAIAMAAASCCKEIKKDIPDVLLEGLEKGKYGTGYLINLERSLRIRYMGSS